MDILASIRKSFEGRAPQRPQFAAADQEAGEKDVGRSHDQSVVRQYADHELSGMTIGIEHVDADGSVSRRWATIVAAADVDGENRLLCHCFRSEGLRSFRMDRIINLFDEQGFTLNALRLLDFMLYYKLPPDTKVVLASTEEEKRELQNLYLPQDLRVYPSTPYGPMTLVRADWAAKSPVEQQEIIAYSRLGYAGRSSASFARQR